MAEATDIRHREPESTHHTLAQSPRGGRHPVGLAGSLRFGSPRRIERARFGRDVVESADTIHVRLTGTAGLEGLAILRFIKEHNSETKVILITAYGNSDIRELAIGIGASCYLEKPVLADDLRAAIGLDSSSGRGES